ncbi:MAG: bifunctional (p)ppGpp synthetase/guanosine-3',5'-bis(diphosphate) 3'-pyrophosphohydrolase [Candidatus Electrothrix aestuarii]|uniref:Bifunctional (P)ppGpp synthetase/guanosine-3',5'-bis(Diphosphate) 3'-pyrophosphohydrolase n=1 Tax=Candidatus Electrothrix aestuarii TaxID=3062594 RepID=A0AAU8LQM2_9BACT|nr:bifunctional (p)ppGpp synthetase/guanosine-3',5'-bis(diphosphate) 3'-pyrophosphohydrolase [Candidatus Electrothrix aestuarii]
MADFDELKKTASEYLSETDLSTLQDAYIFASERHKGLQHSSGKPYVNHLVDVANTVASMHLDLDTIISSLLHGVLKEGAASLEELEERFGPDVVNIVNGTTKITNVRYDSKMAYQAENIRKLFLAMGSDIRVLLVKLVDRLHDMLLLRREDEAKQRQLSRETMDLYAPLASRLGIDWLKRELEDLSFQYLFPKEYKELMQHLVSTLGEREKYVDEVIGILREKLKGNDVYPRRVIGRPKHLYSIYKKLIVQNIPVEQVYDKVAFRIIVNTVKECYEALGTIHGNWTPVPGRIKDFISAPKSNNYQSLHTTVAGPGGHFIEIQIRTEEMDRVAQEGVAAHWAYKEGQKINTRDARLFKELKTLVQNLQEVEDPGEFLDSVRGELFDPDVYALTPNGEVREMPRGSTPIDFAYAIHTAVGDQCTGARVNGRLVQLKYELQNGDIVEIITSKNQHPKRAWLQLVKTSRARAKIRQWLRKEEKEQLLQEGREICERELKQLDTSLKKLIKTGHIRLLLKKLRCNSLDDMLAKVGTGAITLRHLERALMPKETQHQEEQIQEEELLEQLPEIAPQRPAPITRGAVQIDGVDDMLIKISQCCKPVPGDEVIGFITTGEGISVHKANCPSLLATDPIRWVEVNWSGQGQDKHRTELFLRADNRKNLLADISSLISSDKADVIEFNSRTTAENIAEFRVVLEITDTEHLQKLLTHLQQMPSMIEVHRR